ncbi:MAG: hypothetical protein AAB654_04985 [Acidobacteriota bacterium]
MPTLPHNRSAEVVERARISEVWQALGGAAPKRGRARAWWRDGDGLSVSLSDDKGAWYDHARGEGGGILGLIQHVRGGTRADALRWLTDLVGVPLVDRPLTPAERQAWGRAKRAAPALARRAAWWWSGRLAELEDAKADAPVEGRIDIYAAREVYRLQSMSADGIVAAYRRFGGDQPEECARLTRIGWAWERTCRKAVGAVIDKIQQEQREAECEAA